MAAVSGGRYTDRCLVATLIYHPDPARIGQRAILPATRGDKWLLGRLQPDFEGPAKRDDRDNPGDTAGRPLDDMRVSRAALHGRITEQGLELSRPRGSSSCLITDKEIDAGATLSREMLRDGICLTLAHRVVILLRLGQAPSTEPEEMLADGCPLRGVSAYMQCLRRRIRRTARHDLDVLIRGETGTGKELVARAIHDHSRRSAEALVAVNMAAVPSELAAAELFGSVRGAYTGAADKKGYFEQAAGGTLFLDEVGDTPPEVQPQLLRALQQREVQRVGGRTIHVDVRVVSATDTILENANNNFRAALRHRLGNQEIVLFPLREHPEDIGALFWHFLRQACIQLECEHLLPGPDSPAVEVAHCAALFHACTQYHWPGNVRELRNYAGQVVLASDNYLVTPPLGWASESTEVAPPTDDSAGAKNISALCEEEFQALMARCEYQVAKVARETGASRTSVYRRISRSPAINLVDQLLDAEIKEALQACGGDERATAERLKVSLAGLRRRLRIAGGGGAQ